MFAFAYVYFLKRIINHENLEGFKVSNAMEKQWRARDSKSERSARQSLT